MPKRSFIRGVWGDLFNPDKTPTVLHQEIKLNIENKYQVPCTTYVFGQNNEKHINDLGIKTKLLDKRNWVWDKTTELFRHKLELYKIGMEEFDEIVYLDWDVLQLQPLLTDYWENLYKKEKIQGHIHRRRRGTCPWRKFNFWKNRLINAGILILRDKDLPNLFVKTWNEIDNDKFMKMNEDKSFWRFNDEIIIQYVLDHQYGLVEKNKDKRFVANEWIKRFEPEDSLLSSFRALDKDADNRTCFNHLCGNYDRLKKEWGKINENNS